MRNRGQTETLGFVLVFAIITASIGIVYASGFTGLDNARQFEQTNNAQRAFEVFADNIEDITHRNAPSRATEIKLAGSTLTVGEPISIRVNVTGTQFNESYSILPIIYDADTDERIIYVQGAVIRESNDEAVVLQESTMLMNENRTMVPIIRTRLVGTGSIGGSTTVLIRATHAQTDVIYLNNDNPPTVWFNVTSPRADAWGAYLESKGAISSCTVSDGTAACQIDSDRLTLTLVQVDIELD